MGTIVGHHYREPSWTPCRRAPYQVRLDAEGGPLIYVPQDIDECVRTTLRFAVGDAVQCYTDEDGWVPGRVAALYHREPPWPPSQWAPYRVQLDPGPHGDAVSIWAPVDTDECVRAPVEWPWPGGTRGE